MSVLPFRGAYDVLRDELDEVCASMQLDGGKGTARCLNDRSHLKVTITAGILYVPAQKKWDYSGITSPRLTAYKTSSAAL
jgi:hypothetical protein